MTEARVFGPVLGAGVQLNEEVGRDNIIQGELGSTVMVGVMERGVEDDITVLPSYRALSRKCGDLLDPNDFDIPGFSSLDTPLCAKHFWKTSEGAGKLVILRVTPKTNNVTQDDRPTKSQVRIFNREAEPLLFGYAEAHNGGNWAGKRKTYLGAISGVPGVDFPAANQIQLFDIAAKTWKVDEFKNAIVTLDGIPTASYRVVSNDAAGLLTLEADDDVQTDWGAGETYGSEDSDAETFNFGTVVAPWNLTVTTETGGPDTATFAPTAASVGGDGAPAVPVAAGDIVFTVTQDGGSADYTVAFNGEASIAAILVTLNAGLPGCSAQDDGGGNVIVYTDQMGTGAVIAINDAASTTAVVEDVFSIAGPTEVAGTGDVANHFKVTAEEISDVVNAAVALGASDAVASFAGGICTIRSNVVGAAGNVTMAGTLQTLLGYDGLQHDGTDGPADLDVQVVKSNVNERGLNKSLSLEIINGGLRSASEFGIIARIDGRVVLKYENLSMRTDMSNYWADVINDDPNNDVFTVVDSFTGDRTNPRARPANHYGQSAGLTATRLTIADPHISNLTVGIDWVPALAWIDWGTYSKPQRLKVLMLNPTDFKVTTDIGNREWLGTLGVAVDMEDYVGEMTVTTSAGTPQAGDYFYVYLKPLEPDEAIGALVYPNITKPVGYRIIDNDVDWVDVSDADDLTDGGTNNPFDEYRIDYRQQLQGGYDGYVAGMVSSDYEAVLDEFTSPLRKCKVMKLGQVKIAVPGIARYTSALALQQKVQYLASRYNWMAKTEMPWLYHDWDVYYETNLVEWVDDTFGRSEYSSIHFPSYGYIRDPFAESESEARQVAAPLLGYILGLEAKVARQYGGHHKAPAGISVIVPDILELPAVGRPESPRMLDEEVLNPAGINIVKWRPGGRSVILWGDRTLAETTAFRFMHKRNMMSQYENDLIEGFDFSIFAINDPVADAEVLMAVHDYFLPEYRKRAIRGDSFVGGTNPAAIFKMDKENNTDATRAMGDQIIEISLRLADVVERLRIFIGPMGVGE